MSVSDERLDQLANDPMMCNITEETKSALRETIQLRATVAQQAATIGELQAKLDRIYQLAIERPAIGYKQRDDGGGMRHFWALDDIAVLAKLPKEKTAPPK